MSIFTKQLLINNPEKIVKKLIVLIPVIFLFLGLTVYRLADEKLKSLLKQFNTSEESAEENIFYSISGSSFYIPNVKILKSMAVGDRVTLIDAMGKNIKEYTLSKEFAEKYNQLREDRKPTPPETPKYSNELKEEQRKNLINSIAETEKSKSQMPKDQQVIFDEVLKMYKQQLAEIDDPEKTMYKPEMDEYIKQSYDMQLEGHKQDISEWESKYPANNPKPMIKKWINAFLEKSADVDYSAQTKTDKNGKIMFVDQSYERKDNQWKLYFRAGKETVTAARTFAQNWLNELK